MNKRKYTLSGVALMTAKSEDTEDQWRVRSMNSLIGSIPRVTALAANVDGSLDPRKIEPKEMMRIAHMVANHPLALILETGVSLLGKTSSEESVKAGTRTLAVLADSLLPLDEQDEDGTYVMRIDRLFELLGVGVSGVMVNKTDGSRVDISAGVTGTVH